MDNHLDRYFREKLREREFEYEHDWWQKAEVLLDAQRRRRRNLFLRFGAMATLFAGLLGWAIFSDTFEKKAERTNTPQVGSMQTPGIANTGVSEVKTDADAFPPIKDAGIEGNAGNSTNASFADSSIFQFQKSDVLHSRLQNPGMKQTDDKISNHSTLPAASEKTDIHHPESSVKQTPGTAIPQPENGTGLVESSTNLLHEIGHPIAKQHENTADASGLSAPPPLESLLADTRSLEPLQRIPFMINPVQGSIPPHFEIKYQSPKPRRDARLAIGFTVGQMIQPGNAGGGKFIIGQRIGGVAFFSFSKNLYASMGLQYHRRSGTFEVSKAAESRRYRFGLEVDSQLLKPSSLHYAGIPILLGWQQGRHCLEAGFLLDYLAGVRGARGNFEKTTDLPPRKEFKAVQQGWLAEDGYNKLTPAAQLGYRFRLNWQLSLGASANYTFGGIVDKSYIPPVGEFLLKETDLFYFTLQATYIIR